MFKPLLSLFPVHFPVPFPVPLLVNSPVPFHAYFFSISLPCFFNATFPLLPSTFYLPISPPFPNNFPILYLFPKNCSFYPYSFPFPALFPTTFLCLSYSGNFPDLLLFPPTSLFPSLPPFSLQLSFFLLFPKTSLFLSFSL